MSHAHVENVDWHWPANENPLESETQETVRILAPFDPVVHDRARFERLWVGFIALKLTRLLRNASSVTTRCRCYGATGDGLGEFVSQEMVNFTRIWVMSKETRHVSVRSNVN